MRRLVGVCWLVILTGCATTLNRGSHCSVEPGYLGDTSAYSWYADTAIELNDQTGFVSPLIVTQLQSAIEDELRGKGLVYVDPGAVETEPPEVQVKIGLRTRRELVSLTVNDMPCAHVDCWERLAVADPTRFDTQTIGFLSADVYHLGKPIWRGWVERPLYQSDRDEADEVIQAAVPALFESFPP